MFRSFFCRLGTYNPLLSGRFMNRLSSTVELTCWKCNRGLKLPVDKATFTCPCKEKVLLPPTVANYFIIMDCNESYEVDIKSLRRKYHDLQVLLHPDKYTLKPKEEQMNAADQSSLVNKAYSTLIDRYQRGLYLLELNGLAINETDNMSSDVEFLEDIMILNEAIVSSSQDETSLNELDQQIDGHVNEGVDHVKEAFANGDIPSAKDGLVRLKYYINLQQELNNQLSIS